jgi:membrane-associated phospholipid phosphatase
MYVGAHLPLDLVGGSALGLAIGCAINIVRGDGGSP